MPNQRILMACSVMHFIEHYYNRDNSSLSMKIFLHQYEADLEKFVDGIIFFGKDGTKTNELKAILQSVTLV